MLAIFVSNICNIEYFLSTITYEEIVSNNSIRIFKCLYCGNYFLVVVTGYGKVRITSAIEYAIFNYKINLILQAGIAGSLEEHKITIYDIAIIQESFQWDVDFTSLGYKPLSFPSTITNIYFTNKNLTKVLEDSLCNTDFKYLKANIATGDSFITDTKKALFIKNKYCANVVDNESAVVGQIAYLKDIPYISFNVISYFAYNNGSCEYHKYSKEAKIISQKVILKFLKKYFANL